MKAYLASIAKQLKDCSTSLDKTAILIDKPWVLFDSVNGSTKLIFRKDKSLIISKNGKAIVGNWDYIPAVQSLMLDLVFEKLLCNEAFSDEAAIILKLDGTSDHIILMNEDLIADLNYKRYLDRIKNEKHHIVTKQLISGETLEIKAKDHQGNNSGIVTVGCEVTIDGSRVSDGIFSTKDSNQEYYIKDSKIQEIRTKRSYKSRSGLILMIMETTNYYHNIGDKVLINNRIASDGKYVLDDGVTIIVQHGKIAKVIMTRNIVVYIVLSSVLLVAFLSILYLIDSSPQKSPDVNSSDQSNSVIDTNSIISSQDLSSESTSDSVMNSSNPGTSDMIENVETAVDNNTSEQLVYEENIIGYWFTPRMILPSIEFFSDHSCVFISDNINGGRNIQNGYFQLVDASISVYF